uniref:uncharacterized protein LOC122608017 isoform X2 n=1 Tax=Erigeron canadensis TaxID=72917 RepID=UPI001CB8BAC6|nr:uncharacterized protein LOC122608017 isoform X2 [Erigeron canadensis]
MMSSEFEHLRIPIEDIKSATNNFSEDNCIGRGGFGKVYKGQLSLVSTSEGKWLNTMVAVKRLDRAFGQGDPEFWKEIMSLARYKHENLVSLLGFCDEDGEKILVYEYLSNKSLDLHLSNTRLSWIQRLRICIGAARGINFLHNPDPASHQRLLHRDIKSSNILLDQNWNAKVADFGLSKLGPANQRYTFLFNDAVGSLSYMDPMYAQTGLLSKESDVYSFGVVLFEVLCGRLAVLNTKDDSRFLAMLVQKRYQENKLDTIVETSIKEQIAAKCLETFSGITYQCLRLERKERPSMTQVVQQLEIALQYQEAHEKELKFEAYETEESDSDDEDDFWETKLPQDWKGMIKNFNIPKAIYTIKRDLFWLLHKGILFDEGNKFLWINNDGTKCVLISAKRFVEVNEGNDHRWVFQHGSSRHLLSRFPVVVEYHYGKWKKIRCQIKTSILSLNTMYAAKMVFKYSKKPIEDLKHLRLMTLRWKVDESSVYSTHYAELTDDNWYKIRMWSFLNHGPNADFDIEIEELSYYDNPVESGLLIQGIEFQPLEMHNEIEKIKSLLMPIEEEKEDDVYWEKKLPKNYHQYIEISDKHLHYTSKKDLYLLLCAGFLAYGCKMWLFLCKSTGGICSILPPTHILCNDTSYESLETLSLSESRFKEVKELGTDDWYLFTCRLRPFMFSPNYIYACYLVFKFGDNHDLSNNALAPRKRSSFRSTWKARIRPSKPQTRSREFFKVKYKLGDMIKGTVFAHMNSIPPINIPTLMPKNDHGSHDLSTASRIEGSVMPKGHMDIQNSWMEERNDGWMEVRLSKSLHQLENHVSLEVKLWKPEGGSFSGIIVEGIEFRPMQDVSNF